MELERATIGQLRVVKPLPGTLDLSDLKVSSWEERSGFSFKDMLECSYPFRKSNYIAIENDLRNKGRDGEADYIHVRMRQRDRLYTNNLFRVLGDRLLDHTIKYGTTSTRLFLFMLITFVISVGIFNDPDHVEYKIIPSAEQSLVIADPAVRTQGSADGKLPIVHPADWSIGNAAFLAVRLHVPIISLGIDEEFQPSGFWPKAYAVAVEAIGWIVWPLFIASVSGFLRKRS